MFYCIWREKCWQASEGDKMFESGFDGERKLYVRTRSFLSKTSPFKEVFNKKSNNSTEKWPYFKCISYTFCNLVQALIYAQSKQHIELRCTHKKLYLLHTYFCCHSETLKNTSMPISKLFLYVAGVIFIFSRVELSGYIIFQVCCRELTLLQLAEASHFVWLRVERTAQ